MPPKRPEENKERKWTYMPLLLWKITIVGGGRGTKKKEEGEEDLACSW